jgi:hypothetical protein
MPFGHIPKSLIYRDIELMRGRGVAAVPRQSDGSRRPALSFRMNRSAVWFYYQIGGSNGKDPTNGRVAASGKRALASEPMKKTWL